MAAQNRNGGFPNLGVLLKSVIGIKWGYMGNIWGIYGFYGLGFLKIRGNRLGVPRIRIIVDWGLH